MSELNHTCWDACVIGGGPAGSLSALRLAEAGRRVVLIEKANFPRPKVCGGCLGAIGAGALETAGLSLDDLHVRTIPLETLTIHAGGRTAALPLRRRQAIARDAFDEALLGRAKVSGVRVIQGERAAVGPVADSHRVVRLVGSDTSTELRAAVVVIASGLGGASLLPPHETPDVVRRSASRLGVGCVLDGASPYAAREVTMACGRGSEGYVGVARLPGDRLDLAAAVAPRAIGDRPGGLGEAVARVLQDNGLPIPSGMNHADWGATGRLTQRPKRLGAERVLLIGDAAGYVEPFTGEGIGWALRSALEVEPFVHAWIDGPSGDPLADWERRHRATIGRWQRRCRAVCGFIGARNATAATVRALSVAPWLARPVLRGIDPAPATA